MAADAAKLNKSAAGCYVTINKINPDLLARCANRCKERPKQTTADDQVIRRQRLPIDVDATRPAGISASEAEHDAAIALARKMSAWLVDELGWPEPLIGDSGNGGHVLPRIDLPNSTASFSWSNEGVPCDP